MCEGASDKEILLNKAIIFFKSSSVKAKSSNCSKATGYVSFNIPNICLISISSILTALFFSIINLHKRTFVISDTILSARLEFPLEYKK